MQFVIAELTSLYPCASPCSRQSLRPRRLHPQSFIARQSGLLLQASCASLNDSGRSGARTGLQKRPLTVAYTKWMGGIDGTGDIGIGDGGSIFDGGSKADSGGYNGGTSRGEGRAGRGHTEGLTLGTWHLSLWYRPFVFPARARQLTLI